MLLYCHPGPRSRHPGLRPGISSSEQNQILSRAQNDGLRRSRSGRRRTSLFVLSRPQTPDPFSSRPLSQSRVFALLNQERGRGASERGTDLLALKRSSLFRRTALHALKSTHPVSRSVLPPLSERGSQIKSLYRSFFLYQQPTTHNLPRFLPPAERNWHREAILACASRLAKAKPLLAAGCPSRQK